MLLELSDWLNVTLLQMSQFTMFLIPILGVIKFLTKPIVKEKI